MRQYNPRNLMNRLYKNVVLPLATAGTLALTSCIGGATPVEYRTAKPTRETTPIPQPIPIIEKLS